jgi:hypothetical protein
MGKDSPVKISEHFKALTDPRVVGRTNHKLIDIVTLVLCAIICGADNWPEIESYGNAKYDWFNTDFHSRYNRQSNTQIKRSRLSPRFYRKAMGLETVFVVFQLL